MWKVEVGEWRVGEAACWLPEPSAAPTPPTLPGAGAARGDTRRSGGAKTPRVCMGLLPENVRLRQPVTALTSMPEHITCTAHARSNGAMGPHRSRLPTSDGIALKSGSWPFPVTEMSTHMRYEPPSPFAAQIHCSVQ